MDRMMESAEDLASTAKKKATNAARMASDRAGDMAERIQD
jgi:hypothetical protein